MNKENKVVDNLCNNESKKLINLMKENNISNTTITLVLLGLGTHVNYYNDLYNTLIKKKELTDRTVKEEAIKLFHKIDDEEDI